MAKRKKAARPRKRAAVPVPVTITEAPREDVIPGYIQPIAALMRGPFKQRRTGPVRPRISNHKVRSRWFQGRAAWPVREAPVANVVRQRAESRKTLPTAALAGEWESIGPTNIGGRMTSIVCHPAEPQRIWAGAAGGGVWYSPDAGRTWQSLWHSEDILNIGSLAIDATNPATIYCGTGEANLSADSYPGVGIYRTIDGGKSWQLHAASEKTGIPRRIGVIAIDPYDATHLLIGGIGYAEVGQNDDLGGLYRSRDGGVTWERETFISTQNYWCHSIVFHPATRGLVYAAVTARGAASGIYRSEDGGDTWAQLTNGLEPTARLGRITLCISPSNPRVMYALAADESSESSDKLLGVFRSANGGDTWTNVAGGGLKRESQMSYGNAIAVHPTNANQVLCGGVDLYLTTDAGATWTRVTKWDARRGSAGYAHADHHGLLMPTAAPGLVYDVNDGGLDISEDGGHRWANRSDGLATTMYYDLDTAQSDARSFGGGAQDNGTLVTTTGHAYDHFELLGGDGGWIVYDPQDSGHVYASYQNFQIFRFRNGTNKAVVPSDDENEQNFVWMCYIAMDPNDSDTVFTGSYRVWRTKDDGETWRAVSPTLDDSAISAIEIARSDSKRIYVGTENGKIFRSDNGGTAWSPNIASAALPGHTITRLTASPTDANVVYATVANFGHSHVFRSADGGSSWQDIDKGRLPDVPHHAVLIPANAPRTVFVCNDAGVYVSRDEGFNWENATMNLPHVMVVDLVHHRQTDTLLAATYGRSLWRARLSAS